MLDLGRDEEDHAVALEREGVRRTERDPALGGINDSFADLCHAEGALRDAILALPHGDGSRYYSEPGYFANVRASVPAFEFLVDSLPCAGGERLLDLGADLTWSTCHLARRGFACVAVDINHHLGVGRIFQEHYGVGYHLVRADMSHVSFIDRTFDVITAVNALHHGARLEVLARNVARMLKPGGRLGFIEPYCGSETEKQAFGRAQIAAGISEQTYLLEEWDRAFVEAGLTSEVTRIADSFSAVFRKAAGRRAALAVLPAPEAQPTFAEGATADVFSGFYASELTIVQEPGAELRAGELLELLVRVENRGNARWSPMSRFPVYASYHLYREDRDRGAQLLAFDNPRTPLPAEVAPGQAVTVGLRIAAPLEAGDYVAEVDLVHEDVRWFAERGLRGPRVRFRVAS